MRKAKRRCQQLVAAAMCVGMLAGMVPTQVFAEEAQPAAAIAQQEQAPAPSANETETPAPTEEPAAEQTPAPPEEPAAKQTPAPAEEPAAEQTPRPGGRACGRGDRCTSCRGDERCGAGLRE